MLYRRKLCWWPNNGCNCPENPEVSVTVVDINKEKIDLWNSTDLEKLPIYEPGQVM